uniref:UPF0229 protein YeaH n=1 Tax=Caenorhabditis tropicalis TaxID=1561998 RepID=A0A1I7UDR2_9PELO
MVDRKTRKHLRQQPPRPARTVILQGRDAMQKKARHQEEVQALFQQRKGKSSTERQRIEDEINAEVEAWNYTGLRRHRPPRDDGRWSRTICQ